MSFQTLLERRRRTQIAFSKLDDLFVEFLATKKLLIIAESPIEDLLTNLGKVGNQGSSTFQEREIYRTMLRKTTMKILQGTDEDPMSFQKLARRRTRCMSACSKNIFKAGGLFNLNS